MDAYQGPLQWQISYNLIVLRHISFAMDKYWAGMQTTSQEVQAPQQDMQKVGACNIDFHQGTSLWWACLPAQCTQVCVYVNDHFFRC